MYLNPSIHTEVIDREVYTLSEFKISLLKAKAQKAKCNEKKTSVSFADSAYSICFLSLFECRLVYPKTKFSSTCFGEYKIQK